MTSDSRVQDPRELARRIVPHHQAHVVAEILERRRLQLRMLDDRTPERPRERDDDPDLHGVFRKTGDPLARSLRSRKIPEGGCFAAASLGSIGPSLVLSS